MRRNVEFETQNWTIKWNLKLKNISIMGVFNGCKSNASCCNFPLPFHFLHFKLGLPSFVPIVAVDEV